jgi:hypothetical protein
MGIRRLLFVRPPSRVSLVPIYGALVLIGSLSFAGLGHSQWPDRSASAHRQDDRDKTVSASRSREGDPKAPTDSPPPRRSGTWM